MSTLINTEAIMDIAIDQLNVRSFEPSTNPLVRYTVVKKYDVGVALVRAYQQGMIDAYKDIIGQTLKDSNEKTARLHMTDPLDM